MESTAQAGFTRAGLAGLDAAVRRQAESGEVPGLVALVARGGEVHACVAGQATLADRTPMRRDSLFRIASMTKPIVGVAAMLLIEDQAMALGDPVERWLPELAGRRVLRTLESGLDDTVPAHRPITVEDVLSFRLGFGCIMAPGRYPVAEAEASLDLKTLSPPWPPTRLTPDEWIAALGRLPLMDQPGERWRYTTGATVAGILVERVAGAPLAEVMAHRVFGPLGMADTGFHVPPAKLGRFTSMYAPGGFPGGGDTVAPGGFPGGEDTVAPGGFPGVGDTVAPGGLPGGPGRPEGLTLVDSPGGWYSAPPALPDAAAWLVSTADDLHAFTAMVAAAAAGQRGGLLTPESVALMLADRTTARDRAENPWFFGDNSGWGLMMAVPAAGGRAGGTPYGYGWDGGSGTTWRTDPSTGLTGILLTQRMMTSPEPPAVTRDFWAAAYAAQA